MRIPLFKWSLRFYHRFQEMLRIYLFQFFTVPRNKCAPRLQWIGIFLPLFQIGRYLKPQFFSAFIFNHLPQFQNPKGYSIPLDKRLAADGRNLHEQQINDNFANLSEVSVSSNLSLLNQFSAGIIFSRTSGERCNPNAWSDS
jgi:hypothetical protein